MSGRGPVRAAALSPAAGQPPSPDGDGLLDALDALMAAYAGDVPGASVLVVHGGRAVIRRSYGLADVEAGVAASPATNYRLASVTKQFTAAAILLLAESGRLRLDDPVGRWLPSLPPAPAGVTLHQLLTHTSGVVDYEDYVPAQPDEGARPAPLRDADVLRLLETRDRTLFPPGRGYRYSNTGYALLALVVEQASGRGFPAYLREAIFLPLGMEGTLARVDGGPPVPHRAYGYGRAGGDWVRTDQDPTSAVLGDGGIYASIDDLAKWDAALRDGRLLGAASLARAVAPQVPTDAAGTHYGYGWRLTGDQHWHSGETVGFRNVIIRWPGRGMTVVVLSNRDHPEPRSLALRIAALFP